MELTTAGSGGDEKKNEMCANFLCECARSAAGLATWGWSCSFYDTPIVVWLHQIVFP